MQLTVIFRVILYNWIHSNLISCCFVVISSINVPTQITPVGSISIFLFQAFFFFWGGYTRESHHWSAENRSETSHSPQLQCSMSNLHYLNDGGNIVLLQHAFRMASCPIMLDSMRGKSLCPFWTQEKAYQRSRGVGE